MFASIVLGIGVLIALAVVVTGMLKTLRSIRRGEDLPPIDSPPIEPVPRPHDLPEV